MAFEWLKRWARGTTEEPAKGKKEDLPEIRLGFHDGSRNISFKPTARWQTELIRGAIQSLISDKKWNGLFHQSGSTSIDDYQSYDVFGYPPEFWDSLDPQWDSSSQEKRMSNEKLASMQEEYLKTVIAQIREKALDRLSSQKD